MYISVSSQTTLQNNANFFALALYDASAPAVLLETVTPPKPYGNPLQISFTYNCISGHIYVIKLWESVDGTASGVVRNSFSQAVNANSISIRMPEYLEADITVDMPSGQPTYVNLTYSGWSYTVERVGLGTMAPDYTDNTNPPYTQLPTGGFSLIADGDVFQPNEKFVVRFEPQVIPVNPGTASPIFSNGRIITTTEVLTAGDKGQALMIQSATSNIGITMPVLSALADFDFFYLYSNGGAHINTVIRTQDLDRINYNGSDVNTVYLGKMESMRTFKFDGKFYIDGDLPGMQKAGEIIPSYLSTEINTLPCNGVLLQRIDFPRLWNFVQGLDAASVVSDSVWNSTFTIKDGITYYTKKGCFSTGDGSTTFRLPLLVDMVIKGVSANAGRGEIEQAINHTHGELHSSSSAPGGTGFVGGSAGVLDNINQTSAPKYIGGTDLQRVGAKNLIDNIGAYLLIRI